MNFLVSVIIPVYNAAEYVTKAVESALIQPEVAEILLVEDGSKDDSIKVCEELANRFEKVKLFTHANNENKGAGASRNVGIENAKCDFIAFLDADDYYLPDRFIAETSIFAEKPEVDGVYGALGFHYYSEEAKAKYNALKYGDLTTVFQRVKPNELFAVISGLHPTVHGHFHLDTLTVKHSVFKSKTDMFNNLRLHQDTVFLIQLTINCQLVGGVLNKPIGMRGVHDYNRIVNRTERSLLVMWATLHNWAKITSKNKSLVSFFSTPYMMQKIVCSKRIKGFFLLIGYSFKSKYFFHQRKFFNPACLKVFNKYYGNYIIIAKERIMSRVFKIYPDTYNQTKDVIKKLNETKFKAKKRVIKSNFQQSIQ